jgi:nitronate monooxygenase
VGNFVLQAVGHLKLGGTPYITSGGISTGKQLAAALALGAEGVNIGTLFCCCEECPWPQSFKDRVISSTETDTALVNRPVRNTSRMFKNKVAEEMVRIERENWSNFDFKMIRHLISGERGRAAEKSGDPDAGQWSAGQGIGLIEDTPSVAEAMHRLITEGESTIQQRLSGLLVPKPEAMPATARL